MNKVVVISIILCCLAVSCKHLDFGDRDDIGLKNNSDDTILVVATKNPIDTLVPESLFDYTFDNCVPPGSASLRLLGYDDVSEQDSVIFIVILKSVFFNYSWHEIRLNNYISARYLLKGYEIGSFGGLDIPYPPTESMKNMNVYYKNNQ